MKNDHWLMRPTCSEGSSVSGGGDKPHHHPRVLDERYIWSLFSGAPTAALRLLHVIIARILRDRKE